jgi:hypothetical protein
MLLLIHWQTLQGGLHRAARNEYNADVRQVQWTAPVFLLYEQTNESKGNGSPPEPLRRIGLDIGRPEQLRMVEVKPLRSYRDGDHVARGHATNLNL